MTIDEFKKSKEIIESLARHSNCLDELKKWSCLSKGDYGLSSIRNRQGNSVDIPDEAKEIILNVIRAHIESKINKLKKELASI